MEMTLIPDRRTYSITEAATLLGVHRKRLGYTIDALGIPTTPGVKRSRRLDGRALARLRRLFAKMQSQDRSAS